MLSVPSFVCQWITSFLTDQQQLVRLGKYKSAPIRSALELHRAAFSNLQQTVTLKSCVLNHISLNPDIRFSEGTHAKYVHRKWLSDAFLSCSLSCLIKPKLSYAQNVMSKTQKYKNTVGFVCEGKQLGKKLHAYIRSVY